MKKWVIGLLVGIVLFLISIFVFIPNIIQLDRFVTLNITQDGLYRSLINNKDWSTWWPGNIPTETNSDSILNYGYKKSTYHVTSTGYSNLMILISGNNFISKTSLTIIPQKTDTIILQWVAVIPTSFNPIKRLKIYFASHKLNREMGTILEKIRTHFSNTENIYHIKIKNELVKDSFLVSTFNKTKTYPSVNDIYSLINKLRNYIASQAAQETGFPMLNIIKQDSVTWLTKVAIPTNKSLESSSDISFKRMLGFGKILMTEINGGPENIQKAFDQMGNYVNDYHYSLPAIPFQSLVTDRTKEKDTSLWITRIYYPVMY